MTKLEPPTGDPLAAESPAWYAELNSGMEVFRLELKHETARARLETWLRHADVLVTSNRSSGMRAPRFAFSPGFSTGLSRGHTGWKRLLLALAGLMVWAGASNAQTTGQGYVAGGAGTYSNSFTSGRVLQIGGGGGALIQDRFGIGGELGVAGGGGDTWATLSLNMSLHFPKPGIRNGMIPFVSGGYTRLAYFTESGGSNAFNVGAGLTYWYSERKGLLVEFREVVYQALGTHQYWAARVGIAFR